MHKVWINGKFVDSNKAKVSVFDRGFMYGDGAFETMRSYAGVVFRINEHLKRLSLSLKTLKIKVPYPVKTLKDNIGKSLCINNLRSAYIKIIVTRGEGRFGLSYKDIFVPNVVIISKEFEGYPDRIFNCGINAEIIGTHNERSAIAGIKTLNYLAFIMARFRAKEEGFDDAILTNTKGYITEGATSNIFLIKEGVLITPAPESGILPGITRGVIINIAKTLKIPVREKTVSRKELLNADEVFFTSSLAEVLPVTKVGSKRIGPGKVGALTKLFRISYQKQVIREVLK